MDGLREATRGMHLIDTHAIFAQGYAQYRAGFLKGYNPMARTTDSEIAIRAWDNGWEKSRTDFEQMLKRHGGSLSGIRSNYGSGIR